jgi:hypothetical protein
MARFIEGYVRRPVTEISAFESSVDMGSAAHRLRLLDLSAKALPGELVIALGQHERRIHRSEDADLADDSEDQGNDGDL